MAEEDSLAAAAAAAQLPDLQVHISGLHTFFLNQNLAASYSQNLRKLIKQEMRRRRRSRAATAVGMEDDIVVEIEDFPGGAEGFELVARFIHGVPPAITVSNLALLHCAAVSLAIPSLLQQTERFMEGGGIFYCSWREILLCLNSCQEFLPLAESSGLLDRLVCSLLAKIAQNSSDMISSLVSGSGNSSFNHNSSSSSFSEEEESQHPRFFRVSDSTLDSGNKLGSTTLVVASSSCSSKAWWFDDLATLPPKIIERVIKSLGAYGAENNSLLLTRFLLHYLKTTSQKWANLKHKSINHVNYDSNGYGSGEYGGLADTAVYGVVLMGKTAFSSCRALFGVLRVVSGFGLSKECRAGLERLIGNVLDQAKLDDLLVSSGCGSDVGGGCGAYDVNLVVRLIRVFVHSEGVSMQRLKKVGRLIDQYLGEISPDQSLKVSKFIGVAQSLPDLARDCFDGVYRAIDIYLESHLKLSVGERSRLCRCLNYEKLSLEACKDLAKNPKIPPRIAVQALASQKAHITPAMADDQYDDDRQHYHHAARLSCGGAAAADSSKSTILLYSNNNSNNNIDKSWRFSEDSEDMRINIEKMQWRVVELEKLCKDMKGQMMVISSRHNNNGRSAAVAASSSSTSPASLSSSSRQYSPRLC